MSEILNMNINKSIYSFYLILQKKYTDCVFCSDIIQNKLNKDWYSEYILINTVWRFLNACNNQTINVELGLKLQMLTLI